MKTLRLFLIFVLASALAAGQTYSGTSKDKYQVLLKINEDSTLSFAYYQSKNQMYAEFEGRINKINDTLCHISAVMKFGNDIRMSVHFVSPTPPHAENDSDYFQIKKPFIKENDSILIIYSNGKKEYYYPYNKQGQEVSFLLNKKLFKYTAGSCYFVVLNKINEFTGKPLTFKIYSGSGLSFMNGRIEEFDVVLKNDGIRSVFKTLFQTGDFWLIKKSN